MNKIPVSQRMYMNLTSAKLRSSTAVLVMGTQKAAAAKLSKKNTLKEFISPFLLSLSCVFAVESAVIKAPGWTCGWVGVLSNYLLKLVD